MTRQREKNGSLSPEISPVSARGAPPKEVRLSRVSHAFSPARPRRKLNVTPVSLSLPRTVQIRNVRHVSFFLFHFFFFPLLSSPREGKKSVRLESRERFYFPTLASSFNAPHIGAPRAPLHRGSTVTLCVFLLSIANDLHEPLQLDRSPTALETTFTVI